MRRLTVLTALAVVGLCVPATGAAAASSAVPITSCGQVVTSDAVLRADLVCSGDAVTIAASDVTVRLAGHSITSSDGTGAGIRIDTTACDDNVTVEGGTISGFFGGIIEQEPDIYCGISTGNRVSAMTLTDNTWGLHLACDAPWALDHITVVGPNGIGSGIYSCAPRVTMSHATIDVTSPDGLTVAAIFDWGSAGIDSSRLTGGLVQVVDSNFDITHSHLTGVSVNCGDANLSISDSRLIDSAVPSAMACGEYFSRDRFTGPGAGTAIDLSGAGYPGRVTDSVFTGWGTAIQMDYSDNVQITGNTFRSNGTGVAICAASYCEGSGTISGNRFVDNTGPGLVLPAGTWHVGSNVALRNGGLGIDAEGTNVIVIDDGGNIARRNQPPQCIGVVCTP